MKLLITTQAVDLDDPTLGFFHRWLEEFAKHCDSIEVICLKEGRHALPKNVHVHSLGKVSSALPQAKEGRLSLRIRYITRFYRYIWKLRKEYDAIFVHMNPEYVLLGGAFWRLRGQRVGLWYVHRETSFVLSVATLFSNVIFTAAHEGIGIRSKKVDVVGHGIDVARFTSLAKKSSDTTHPRILTVGRITPIKHLEVIIDALAKLRASGVLASLHIIGAPTVASDKLYEAELRAQVERLGISEHVVFDGARTQAQMPELYASFDLSVNACPTGGIDKTVLESMASGVPVFVGNIAFQEYFGPLSLSLIFKYGDAEDLAQKIRALLSKDEAAQVGEVLRTIARERADISRLVPVIIERLYGRIF